MPHAPAEPDRYAIRLQGQLDAGWSDWFEGFRLTAGSDGSTTLTGRVLDQAALHGLLRRIGDLGLTLISINPIDTRPQEQDPR
jgi:hypothetical protein